MSNISVLLIDDEPLARKGLRLRLQQLRDTGEPGCAELNVLEAANARSALDLLAAHSVQLMFVDIQMPGTDGLTFIRNLSITKRPFVIMTTAFQQYALDAFGVQAVDYLLKPVDAMALKRAWRRAYALMQSESHPIVEHTSADQMTLKDGKEIHKIAYDRILWIEAAGDYVVVHSALQNWVGRCSLAELEQTLPQRQFVRIHRGCIVHKQAVVRLRPHINGEYFLDLCNGHQLKLSRGYKSNVEVLLG
jgi:two-component system, LytTR family, response regulator